MSVNRNRAKLNKAEDGSTYRKYWINHLYPPYWDEDYSWSRAGGEFPNYKWRSYRTWKHNRKRQWKTKNLNSNKE